MIIFPEIEEGVRRYFRAFEGKADRVPILAQMNEHVVNLCGGNIWEAYTNAERFVEMNLTAFQYYGFDMPSFYYDVYNIEAEALGQRMNWEPLRMPEIDRKHPLIENPSDLRHLRPPDFKKSGRLHYVLEIIQRCHDLGLPVRIRFCSPFSLAVNVRGIEALLMDILTAPQFAHRLLAFLTEEVLVPWIQTQRDVIGQSDAPATGADAAASPPIVNVEILEEFVMPYVQRMSERIRNVTSVGYWGYSYLFKQPTKFRQMLELMAGVSPKLLMCLDPDVAATGPEPYAQFAEERKMSLMLGLDALLMQDGPIEKIADRCRRYILVGAKDRKLIFFFNDIPINTPPAHVHAAVAAVRYFGKYPVEIHPFESFEIPPFESFEVFKRRMESRLFNTASVGNKRT